MDFIFILENAAAHTTQNLKQLFLKVNLGKLQSGALSPISNCVQNNWVVQAKQLHINKMQFYSVTELTAEMLKTWDHIHTDILSHQVEVVQIQTFVHCNVLHL